MVGWIRFYRLIILTLISFGLTLLPAACQTVPQTSAVISIGLIAPLTGEAAERTGKPTLEGAKLAVTNINESGRLKLQTQTYNVELIVADDQDNPDEAVAAANWLINEKNVVALVGLPRSRIAIPVSEVAEESGIPMISSKSTNPKTTEGKKYVFRVPFLDNFQGQVLANFGYKDLGKQRAAVLYDIASDYNRGLAEFFKQSFEALGGEVVAFESYTTDQVYFTEQLQNISESRAEVLFLPNYAEEVTNQVKQIRDLGLDLTLMGSDSWGSLSPENYLTFEGTFYTDSWTPDLPTPQTKAFVEDYQRTYQKQPNSYAALSYDAVGLIFTAIKTTGKAEPESIQKGLANLQNYDGVTGRISYQGSGDPLKSAVVLNFKDGKLNFYKLVNPQ